ncbi:MAG: hypothetical protein U1E67_04945 [Hyphomicrobiales bacterium]
MLNDILGFDIPDPVRLIADEDQRHAAAAGIKASTGGELTATAANGTVYHLAFPPHSLLVDTRVTLTPLSRMRAADGSPEGLGFDLAPAGTILSEPAIMEVKLSKKARKLLGKGALDLFETRGRRGDEAALLAIQAQKGFGMLVTHFSGGMINVGGKWYPRVPLVSVGWTPIRDHPESYPPGEDGAYQEAGDRMAKAMGEGDDPAILLDALQVWWNQAVDEMISPSGGTEAERATNEARARYNVNVAHKLMEAFANALRSRFDAITDQIVKINDEIQRSSDATARDALIAANEGLAESVDQIIDAFNRMLSTERSCQLAGCPKDSTAMDEIGEILDIYAMKFKLDCNNQTRMLEQLRKLAMSADVLGKSQALLNFIQRANNIQSECYQYEVVIDANQEGHYIDGVDLVYKYSFDVEMRVVLRLSPDDIDNPPAAAASVIIRNASFRMRDTVSDCTNQLDFISASLQTSPTVVLDRVTDGFQVKLTPGKIDTLVRYTDVCTAPDEFSIPDLWDESFKQAMREADYTNYFNYLVPIDGPGGTVSATKTFQGSASWAVPMLKYAATQKTTITVKQVAR